MDDKSELLGKVRLDLKTSLFHGGRGISFVFTVNSNVRQGDLDKHKFFGSEKVYLDPKTHLDKNFFFGGRQELDVDKFFWISLRKKLIFS